MAFFQLGFWTERKSAPLEERRLLVYVKRAEGIRMTLLPETENFLNQPVLFQSAGGFEFAYRKFGSGAPLVFLHGWPLTGFTFRKIIPPLARDFTCKMPVLLIWGKEDRIFPARRAREMAAQFPNCKGFEEIPDAGLLVHEEQPKPVAQKILNFLNS